MHVIFGPWTPEDVAVLEISHGEWRVSDLTCREEDGMAVLGFIEQTKLGYEATGIHEPAVAHAFSSFARAVAFISSGAISDDGDSDRPELEFSGHDPSSSNGSPPTHMDGPHQGQQKVNQRVDPTMIAKSADQLIKGNIW